MDGSVGTALLLATLAGLSTTAGSLMSIFVRSPGPRFMTLTLGFSGGVMLLISFVELLQGGIEAIGFGPAHLAFFGGMVAMYLIDALVPHEYMAEHHCTYPDEQSGRLLKTGLLVAVGIGIHNFPEGIASFVGALEDLSLGFAIAVAIAIHNIPEGLAVSAPVFAATGSRKKAFICSFLSGIAEPVGAALAALVLMPFLNEAVLGYVLSAVGGIMVFIAIDELVPVSRSFGIENLSIVGVVAGMMITALSLWMLQ
jgi:ZIP family zinc transporter